MLEAVCDYRALSLLEQYIGYDEVINLCEGFFGETISVNTMAESTEQMYAFREMINNKVLKYTEDNQ